MRLRNLNRTEETTQSSARPAQACSLAEDQRLAGQPLLVCLLVVPEGTELTLHKLHDALSREFFREGRDVSPPDQTAHQRTDSWLTHSEAAEHLGVSESTLYRYAERHMIESRKLCGRLQYRLSTLDNFKDQHIRPAHRSFSERDILSTAPTSGK